MRYERPIETEWTMSEPSRVSLGHVSSRSLNLLRRVRHRAQMLIDGVNERTSHVTDVVNAVSRYGTEVARRTDVPIPVQLMQALYLRARYGISGDTYYLRGMYDEGHRAQAPFFVRDATMNAILCRFAEESPEGSFEPLHDKRAFEILGVRHGLPIVPSLGYFGFEEVVPIASSLPAGDLFSKPTRSWLGQGTSHWTYLGRGRYRNGGEQAYTRAEMMRILAQQAEEEPLVLQRYMTDAAPLRERTGRRGPSTLRIVTLRRPDGVPEFFRAFIILPLKRDTAPTFSGRTAMAAAVRADGRLGRLYFKAPSFLPAGRSYHPQSLERMTGWKLPFWDSAKQVVLDGHATLPEVPCVGWDLVLTDEGPRLLEANNDCSVEVLQITHREMLGRSRLMTYLNERSRQFEVAD